MHPELRRVDAGVLDLREGELLGVDIVHREEARDPLAPGRRGHQPGHPVVAVHQVRLHVGDDVVDDLALERERELDVAVAARVDGVAVVEAAVLGEVDALVGEVALVLPQLVGDQLRGLDVEHPPVVRQRHVHVGAELVQRLHQRRRDVGHATGLGGHLAGEVAHSLRKIGNLRRDDQDSRVLGHVHSTAATTSPLTTWAPCLARNVILPDADALIGLKSFIASTTHTASPALTCAPSAASGGLPGASLR